MNEKNGFFLFFVLFALILAGCSGGREEPPLEGATIGGPFTLTDQDKREVTDQDFKGKYRIIYFGFTYCPDVCPVDLQSIGQAMRLLEKTAPEKAGKIQPIFISVDPERDTPDVLKRYVSVFHPRLIGLTGTTDQIAKVARSFGIYHSKGEASDGAYLVDHSRVAILFGPEGEPIAILPHEQGPEAIAAELQRWVK